MTDETLGETSGESNEKEDLGEPVEILADVTLASGPDFLNRVRRKIELRVLASQILRLSWAGTLLLLLEFVSIPFELFRSTRHDRGGPD